MPRRMTEIERSADISARHPVSSHRCRLNTLRDTVLNFDQSMRLHAFMATVIKP